MPRRILIDTDPGQDDAVALLVALASPQDLDVVAVTAVAGNVPLKRTADNCLRLVELAARPGVPVYAGAARPMVRPPITAEYVHGPSGIDGADLPPPSRSLHAGYAPEVIVETVMGAEDDSVTLCTLGPLTNVALAMRREPAVAARAAGLVMMGGGFFEGGNTTPAAEFNILSDPHAADIVFRSGIDIVMMPLDVTHKARTTPDQMAKLEAVDGPVAEAVVGMLSFYDRWDKRKYDTPGGPLHDPCVIAYLLAPGLFTGKRVHVAVETSSELTMGMTVMDWWGVTDNQPNALVMHDIDADGYFDLIAERIGRLPG